MKKFDVTTVHADLCSALVTGCMTRRKPVRMDRPC
jgi:hypothetical protein